MKWLILIALAVRGLKVKHGRRPTHHFTRYFITVQNTAMWQELNSSFSQPLKIHNQITLKAVSQRSKID
jgi:hypothetical protein